MAIIDCDNPEHKKIVEEYQRIYKEEEEALKKLNDAAMNGHTDGQEMEEYLQKCKLREDYWNEHNDILGADRQA